MNGKLHERGVVRSREPFNFWWAPTISPERLKLESSNLDCIKYYLRLPTVTNHT